MCLTGGGRAEVCHSSHAVTCGHKYPPESLLETLYALPRRGPPRVAANEKECVKVKCKSTGNKVYYVEIQKWPWMRPRSFHGHKGTLPALEMILK